MIWDEWFQREPNGQKFMTGASAARFMRVHPERCHVSDEEAGLPDVVLLDRPYKLRVVREVDLHWLEVMRMKDLAHWPPIFGVPHEPHEVDPKMFEVAVSGGEAVHPFDSGSTPYLRILGTYGRREVSTDVPCAPELLARCAAETLNSLRGRLVMEIGEEELQPVEASRRRRAPGRSRSGTLRPGGR